MIVPVFHKHSPNEWSLQWFAWPINISQSNDAYNGSLCPKTLLRGVVSMIVPVFHKHSPEEWPLQWFALPKNISQSSDLCTGSFCPINTLPTLPGSDVYNGSCFPQLSPKDCFLMASFAHQHS